MGMGGTAPSGATTTGLVWQHANIWAGGKLLGTYDNDGLHFYLDDPLGTRRAQTNYAGVLEQTCQSLPYGDALTCVSQPDPGGNISPYIASLTAPTEHHFTGKERDTESGNDYFEARYYSSAMGRFLSPDWSAKEEPVPYAKLNDPQTLNLYAYVGNSPMTRFDADGHGDKKKSTSDTNDKKTDTTTAAKSDSKPKDKTDDQNAKQKAPSEPTEAQTCLNNYYNSTGGKVMSTFSLASFFWGPDPAETAAHRAVEHAAVEGGEAAGHSSLTTLFGKTNIASPLERIAGLSAKGIKVIGEVLTVEATLGDVAVHFSCVAPKPQPYSPAADPTMVGYQGVYVPSSDPADYAR